MSEFVSIVEASTDGQQIREAYNKLGVNTALRAYIDQKAGEAEVAAALVKFSGELSTVALGSGSLDVAAVRYGVEYLTSDMNQACNEKHGFLEPTGRWQALLVRAGHVQLQTRQYIRLLDDRYWNKQFPEDYQSGKLVPLRQPQETEQQHLARYVHSSIYGLLFAPFTYMS